MSCRIGSSARITGFLELQFSSSSNGAPLREGLWLPFARQQKRVTPMRQRWWKQPANVPLLASQLETPRGPLPSPLDEEYPAVKAIAYELRFTHRALADLTCPRGTPPGDFAAVREATNWPAIVDEFLSQRYLNPDTTGGTLARCGFPDVAELHGPAGGRACTWHDEDNEVVWFLGFDSQHRYERFETRAANDELLPDLDDIANLDMEREKKSFDDRILADLRALVARAVAIPDEPQRGTVGGLLRLEASVTVVSVGQGQLMDVFISVRLPLRHANGPAPPGWPAGDLQSRLVKLVFGDEREWLSPTAVPSGAGATRAVVHGEELAVQVPNCLPGEFAP